MSYHFFPPRPIKFSDAEHNLILQEIESMLTCQIILEVSLSAGQYLSNIFSRVKKDGSLRLILNLESLNKDMEYHHFKMSLQTFITLMHPQCCFASIDLKDVYFSVNMYEMDGIFLRFLFDDRLFSFKSLVQGLCMAPRVFTKLLKADFAFLRRMGHQNVGYIDDSLLVAASFLSCWHNMQDTVFLWIVLDLLFIQVRVQRSGIDTIKYHT